MLAKAKRSLRCILIGFAYFELNKWLSICVGTEKNASRLTVHIQHFQGNRHPNNCLWAILLADITLEYILNLGSEVAHMLRFIRSHFKRVCSRNCLRRSLIGQVSLPTADITIPSKNKSSAEWRSFRRMTISRGANWKVLSSTSPFEFYEVVSNACNGVNKPCKWHAVAILGQYAC